MAGNSRRARQDRRKKQASVRMAKKEARELAKKEALKLEKIEAREQAKKEALDLEREEGGEGDVAVEQETRQQDYEDVEEIQKPIEGKQEGAQSVKKEIEKPKAVVEAPKAPEPVRVKRLVSIYVCGFINPNAPHYGNIRYVSGGRSVLPPAMCEALERAKDEEQDYARDLSIMEALRRHIIENGHTPAIVFSNIDNLRELTGMTDEITEFFEEQEEAKKDELGVENQVKEEEKPGPEKPAETERTMEVDPLAGLEVEVDAIRHLSARLKDINGKGYCEFISNVICPVST